MDTLPTGTVTFLFTDVEGSTKLQYELGVERYAEVRAEHHRLLREACARHGGVEVDAAGDGLFVAFPTASGATAAAIDAQLALKDLVSVRMGLHSGEPLLTPEGYAGVDVASAARIAGIAHGGQVLLSQTAADLVGHELRTGVSLRDLGEHNLKDLRRPERLHQVVVEGLPSEFPPLRGGERLPTNLPTQRPELIGRDDELRVVAELLRGDRRLITLTGPGGTGKTALALEAAARAHDRFADGVFLVRLETVDDPALVMSAIADVLPARKVEGLPPEQVAADFLRDREVLVVLDNFEYVLAAAPAVAELLAGAPRTHFLVTSIAPLRVAHELEMPVEPLALPGRDEPVHELALSPAVALFTERARGVRPGFALTEENAAAIAHVCVALDGLPLALELAAARTRVLSPTALVERVDRPLALLEGGDRDAPDRHRTLRATIDWSYELLDVPTQRLYARASILSGGAALGAIDAICRPREDLGVHVVDGLAHLVECNMLKVEERDDDLRFVMLETLREYAREQLDASGDTDELRRRHAEFFLGDPALAEVFLAVGDEGTRLVLARLETDLDNVRSALEWAHETGSPLELALAVLYQRSPRVFPAEARSVLERALAADAGENRRLRARALAAVGGFARMQGDVEGARAALEASVDLYREIGDTTGALVHGLLRLSRAAGDRDDLEAAARLARESESLARGSDAAWLNRGLALTDLGVIALARGEYEEARRLLDESKVLLAGRTTYVMHADSVLVRLAILEGRYQDAIAGSARLVRQLELDEHDHRDHWALLADLAAALHGAGDPRTGVRLWSASHRQHTERGTTAATMAPPRLWERLYGDLQRDAEGPRFEAAAREGRGLDLEGAVAFGLAAAERVAGRP